MKWHFWFKTLFRKLILFLSAFMGVILLTKSNLIMPSCLEKRPEIKYFIEEYFVHIIKLPYNIFFCLLIAIGVAFVLVGKKRYDNRYRDGIWLTNIGIAYLATTFVAYGVTTLGYLKLVSWEVVVAFLLGVSCYAMLVKNLLNYKRNRRILEEDTRLKLVKIPAIVGTALSIVIIVVFALIANRLWDESFDGYRSMYTKDEYHLMDEEYEDKRYLYVKFVNLFNPDEKTFTLEELNESIDNFKGDSGSWYTLWYFNQYLQELDDSYGMEVNFSSYGYSKKPSMNFANLVWKKLKQDGINPEEATYEQMDSASQYVYEIYINQTPLVVLGDDEEICVDITIPHDGNVQDIEISCDSDSYYGYINEWLLVEKEGQEPDKDAQGVETLENGNVYYARVRIPFVLPYFICQDANIVVTVNGEKCHKVYSDSYGDMTSVEIWVTLGGEN